jgi:hypothetical protein
MNLGLTIPRNLYTNPDDQCAPSDQCAASAMDNEALADSVAVCCFTKDCPTKGLESAVLAEAMRRLKHPITWRLRRWWQSRG